MAADCPGFGLRLLVVWDLAPNFGVFLPTARVILFNSHKLVILGKIFELFVMLEETGPGGVLWDYQFPGSSSVMNDSDKSRSLPRAALDRALAAWVRNGHAEP